MELANVTRETLNTVAAFIQAFQPMPNKNNMEQTVSNVTLPTLPTMTGAAAAVAAATGAANAAAVPPTTTATTAIPPTTSFPGQPGMYMKYFVVQRCDSSYVDDMSC